MTGPLLRCATKRTTRRRPTSSQRPTRYTLESNEGRVLNGGHASSYGGHVNDNGDRDALAGLAARLLRRPHDETQLTKALRELMRAQPALSRVMVSELLGCVNAHDEIPSSAITVVGEKPAVAERWLRSARPIGRTDWVFTAPDDDFELIVEVKIGHSATAEQVARYVRSLASKRGRVVLLTRDPTDVRINDARFLGGVRWQKLLPRLLAAKTPPSIESLLWHALLEHAIGLRRPRGPSCKARTQMTADESWPMWRARPWTS